jgi:hypothetical protein
LRFFLNDKREHKILKTPFAREIMYAVFLEPIQVCDFKVFAVFAGYEYPHGHGLGGGHAVGSNTMQDTSARLIISVRSLPQRVSVQIKNPSAVIRLAMVAGGSAAMSIDV